MHVLPGRATRPADRARRAMMTSAIAFARRRGAHNSPLATQLEHDMLKLHSDAIDWMGCT